MGFSADEKGFSELKISKGNLNLPLPAAGGVEKYAISYITPAGLGKNVRLGSYKPITPTGFWKAAANNRPRSRKRGKTPVPQGHLIE